MVPRQLHLPNASVLHSILPTIFNVVSQLGFDEVDPLKFRRVAIEVGGDPVAVDESWWHTYLALGHATLGLALTLKCNFAEQYSLNLIRDIAFDRGYILAGNERFLNEEQLVHNLTNYKLMKFDEAGLKELRSNHVVYKCRDTGATLRKQWYSEPVLHILHRLCEMVKSLPNPHHNNGSYGLYGLAYAYLKDREERKLKPIKLNTVVRYIHFSPREVSKHTHIPPVDFILFLGRCINDQKQSLLKGKPSRSSDFI